MLSIINYIVKRAMILVIVVSCYPALAAGEGPAESTSNTSSSTEGADDGQKEPSKDIPVTEPVEQKVIPKEVIVSYGIDASLSVFAQENQELTNDELEITPVFICTKYKDTPVDRDSYSKPLVYDDIDDREWVVRGLDLASNVVVMEPLERCVVGVALVELDRASGAKVILKGSSVAFGLISGMKLPVVGAPIGDGTSKFLFEVADEEDLDEDDALGIGSVTLTNAGKNGLEYKVATGPKTELVSVTQEGSQTPSATHLSSGTSQNNKRRNTFNFSMKKKGSYSYKISIDINVDRSEKEIN